MAADPVTFKARVPRWRAAWPVAASWALGGILVAAAVLLDGLEPDPATTLLFVVLILVCGAILVRGARRLGRPAAGWLRPRLWER
jgi:hypothetical protein